MNPFDVLTDDAVVTVGQWVGATGAANLARLQKTCRRLASLLGQPALLRDVVKDRSVAYKITSLEQLAFWEAVEEAGLMEENRIGFDLASLAIDSSAQHATHADDIQDSMARIFAVRRIAHRFPETRILIEAHTGTIAPPYIGVYFSRSRGEAVGLALLWQQEDGAFHLDTTRMHVTGWGIRISQAAARDLLHPHGALARRGKGWAEIYLVHGRADLQLPSRPDFYQGVVPPGVGEIGEDDASDDTSDDDDDGDGDESIASAGRMFMMAGERVLLAGDSVGEEDSVTLDEE
jgi:hypothetical protein